MIENTFKLVSLKKCFLGSYLKFVPKLYSSSSRNAFLKALYFPKREIVTYDYVAESKDLPYARQEVLNKIQKKKAKIIVTTIEAMMQKMVAKSTLYQNKLDVQVGKSYSLEGIKQTLLLLGYERNDLVENKAQFSVRGDILDIASLP